MTQIVAFPTLLLFWLIPIMQRLISIKISKALFPAFSFRREYRRIFQHHSSYIFTAVCCNIGGSNSSIRMTRHNCGLAYNVINKPYEVIPIYVKIIQTFIVCWFSMTVNVDSIDMPILTKFRHHKSIVFPDAHLPVDQQERRFFIAHFTIVYYVTVRKRDLFFFCACRLQCLFIFVIPVRVMMPIKSESNNGSYNYNQ